MHDLDFLVPSALVDPALAPELLRDRPLPALDRVVARGGRAVAVDLPEHASPNAWQAMIFATRAGPALAQVNVAELWAMACGIAPAARGGRWLAEPAHFTVANDHLRLDDPVALTFTIDEARALADAIVPVLAEAGWTLDPIEPATLRHWMLSRTDDVALSAPAIDRAIGDNVARWQPRGRDDAPDAALTWRRCVNEIQMVWFDHPVNAAREAAGHPGINTLWLSGNGAPRAALPRYRTVDSTLPLLASLPVAVDAACALESFDDFAAPAWREDWSGWREALPALDRRVADVLRRQADGSIGRVTLMFCGRDGARLVTLQRRDGAKFWRDWGRKASLAALFGEGVPA